MQRFIFALCIAIGVTACGKDNPVNPSPNPPAATSGTLSGAVTSAAGGAISGATVTVEGGATGSLQATTDGGGQYSFPSLAFAGYTLRVRHPNYVEKAQGVNFTSTQAVNVSLLPAVPWSFSGSGDNVFTIPGYFARVRIQAVPGSSCQNFVVYMAGSLKVNVILGTCSVADARVYDGVLTNQGGTVEIRISAGVSWTFSEAR